MQIITQLALKKFWKTYPNINNRKMKHFYYKNPDLLKAGTG